MATSGSCKTGSYSGRYYQVDWTATQSVANNQSTIKWTLKAVGGTSSWFAERTLKVVLAGSTVFSKTDRVERYAGTIASGTKVITHDSNGDASFNITIEAAVYVSTVNCKGSETFDLDKIPRSSKFGTISGDTIGSDITVNITRYSSSFTHQLWYKVGDSGWYDLGTGIGTSKTFTIKMSLCNEYPSSTSGTMQLCLRTYNGSKQVGSDVYTNVKVYVPSSVKPSCSLDVTDSTGYADTYGSFIKGLSKFKVVVTATKAYDSEISSYSTTANGSTYTASSFTTGVLKSSGDLTVKATVKDKRGRSGSASVSKNVIDYAKPTISKLAVNRCNEDGSSNDKGEYVKVTFSGNVTSLNSKNTAKYVLKYKKTSDSSFTSVTMSDYTNSYSVANATYIFAADSGSSYDVQLEITDTFDTVSKSTSASTGFTLIHFMASGLGMALGKIAELAGYLDIAFKTLFRESVEFANAKVIYGTKPDGSKTSAFSPCNVNGDIVVGYGNYDNKNGDTLIYGHDVRIGVSNVEEVGNYIPYYRKGMSVSMTLITAGFVTNSGKDVYFWIPLSKPMFGSPTVTLSSINGFILRNGGQYTHGSGTSNSVKPDFYYVYPYQTGLYAKASFTDTTNVSNNNAIGIQWNGTVTFS